MIRLVIRNFERISISKEDAGEGGATCKDIERRVLLILEGVIQDCVTMDRGAVDPHSLVDVGASAIGHVDGGGGVVVEQDGRRECPFN